MSTRSFDASEVVPPDIACPDMDPSTVAQQSDPSSDVASSADPSLIDLRDRRKPGLKSFLYGALNPRRRRIRREEDQDHTYLDWHPTHLIVVCAGILALSIIDGLLTLYLVHSGVAGFGSLSAALGENGPTLFALAKFVLTAAATVGLVLTAHMKIYRFAKASTILYIFLCAYVVLVINQAVLAIIMV